MKRAFAILGLMLCLAACQPAPTLVPTVTPTQSPQPTVTALPATATLTAALPSPVPSQTVTLIPTEGPTPTLTLAPVTGIILLRGPYLQDVTPQSIIVVWETDKPSAGSVAYGESEVYGLYQDDPTVAKKHAVTLSGLKPYTTYYYRLEINQAPLSAGYSFRSAAGADQTSFSFAVFGDTRTNRDAHQSVVDLVTKWKPDFYLNTGDLVESGTINSDWDTFFAVEQKLMAIAPLFPVLGNHEMDNPAYFDAFYLPGNKRWYTFEYGNARFIALEIDSYQDVVDPLGEQFKWLEQTLAANTQPWVFVYFHIPTSVMQGLVPNYLDKIFTPLFEKYNVSMVLSGHMHNYQRRIANGTTYIITGGGGAPLYDIQPGNMPAIVSAKTYHAIYITIHGSALTALVSQPDGTQVDAFTLTLP